jgi:hypothetical protein
MIYKAGHFGGEFGYMSSSKCRIDALMTVGLKLDSVDFKQRFFICLKN